ncbi:MAG TPA: MarR family transcriptional regulator [Candidatus Dormibacteraeota bacterium]|nr:MarR family transcriptional regulator [Candidatus Dormibacteraeota bacterium]
MPKRTIARPSPDPNLAHVAALIGDPGRSTMLLSLLDGRTLSAGELARRATVSPTAASAHLSKLVAGGLIVVQPSGRRRLYRLAGADVGRALEALAVISKPARIVALAQSAIAGELRIARSCYDHLAGRLGVGITDSLVARKILIPGGSHDYTITNKGHSYFTAFGLDVADAQSKRRHFASQCLDWTEHRSHLAGALGAALCDRLLDSGWVVRTQASRALHVTPLGRAALEEHFSLRLSEATYATR